MIIDMLVNFRHTIVRNVTDGYGVPVKDVKLPVNVFVMEYLIFYSNPRKEGEMSKFRKKPVIIEAVQLTWKNWAEICEFAGVGELSEGKPEGFNPNGNSDTIGLHIPTLEGVLDASENDWIIKGVKGELYACKPDIFKLTYEEVN